MAKTYLSDEASIAFNLWSHWNILCFLLNKGRVLIQSWVNQQHSTSEWTNTIRHECQSMQLSSIFFLYFLLIFASLCKIRSYICWLSPDYIILMLWACIPSSWVSKLVSERDSTLEALRDYQPFHKQKFNGELRQLLPWTHWLQNAAWRFFQILYREHKTKDFVQSNDGCHTHMTPGNSTCNSQATLAHLLWICDSVRPTVKEYPSRYLGG